MKLSEEVVASLKPGENLIAGYCHNRVGNGLLDFGLLVELDGYRSFHQTAQQTSVDVQPMQTYYNFTCGPVDLNLKFTAPLTRSLLLTILLMVICYSFVPEAAIRGF